MASPSNDRRRIAKSLCRALYDDPFYRAIAAGHAESHDAKEAALVGYFEYSMTEAERIGRLVVPEREHYGAAMWLLPTSERASETRSTSKQRFLRDALGPDGLDRYSAMVRFMSDRSRDVVPPGSWYLSIVAVAPEHQGRGLGEKLLRPTLTEADSVGAACFLETFSARSVGFYARLGFQERARPLEPTTGEPYRLMLRPGKR